MGAFLSSHRCGTTVLVVPANRFLGAVEIFHLISIDSLAAAGRGAYRLADAALRVCKPDRRIRSGELRKRASLKKDRLITDRDGLVRDLVDPTRKVAVFNVLRGHEEA
jgi:hypothetical protein